MRLKNTSRLSDAKIHEIIRFVKPSGSKVRLVTVRKGRYGHAGRYYTSRREIVVTLGLRSRPPAPGSARHPLGSNRAKRFRLKATPKYGGKGYLDFFLLDEIEDAVEVLAHEFRHDYQGQATAASPKMTLADGYVKPEPGRIVFSEISETPFPGAEFRTGVRLIGKRRTPHRRGMVWGSRGTYSERDADAYAIRKVRAWRRAHPPEPRLDAALFEIPFERYRKMEIQILADRGNKKAWFIEDRLTRQVVKLVHTEAAADRWVNS